MSDWVTKPLGELITLQRGHDLPSQDRKEGTVPIMGSSGITGYHDEVKTTGPGVVIGRSGNSMGEVSFSPIDFWPLNTCLYVTDFKGNDERYIYYLLQTINFDQFNSGSAQKSLNRNAVYPYEVKTTECKEEQVRIARNLADLEDKIELNRQTNQTLEHMAQAIFKSWFVDFEPTRAKALARAHIAKGIMPSDHVFASTLNLGEDVQAANAQQTLPKNFSQADADQLVERAAMAAISGKPLSELHKLPEETLVQLKTTAALFPETLVDSELGEVPEGWRIGMMQDCCIRVESGGTPKRSEESYWGGDIKWLSSGEVRDVIVLDTKGRITELGLNKSSAKLWPKGSTVVAMYGATAGQICLLATEMTANQACCALIPKVNQEAYLFLAARRSIEDLAGKASGSAQQNLNKSLVAEHKLIIPSIELLEIFEQAVSNSIGRWIYNCSENIILADARDILLPKLLSGKLIK